MQHFDLNKILPENGEILCIGAHSDDIEIGAGGTLTRLLKDRQDLSVTWVVCTAGGVREQEARASAQTLLANSRSSRVLIKTFRNGYFPYIGAEIKEFFETLKDLPQPQLILTHCQHDLHQDHRVVSELTRNTFRDHCILEYEIPKFDGDLRTPNAYFTFEAVDLAIKVDALMTNFSSQHDKAWFTAHTFESLARLRGNECNSQSGYAEGFYCRKFILG
jgi:LmbE family N-acetylglucosaminyl deacetylase